MKEALDNQPCGHLRGAVCTHIPPGELSNIHILIVEGQLAEVPLCTRPLEGSVQKRHCLQYDPDVPQIISASEIE
jgi:hypothetical protein